ncbi:AGE family epimerase/isomerase [Nocardiopsis sp. HNM0947]|uniref:AGE family epimerase/isomerase n=1 Tax=Nocardiopsis coralli TaxID=2772213 RepID=A0ABR9PD61_9ACTN|nr:AGE family epimerase/isomerase [Nocardiopsis coralli]MBE3001771.1 AGE family epimerase/isomerase [Nocardiopsis coralli]
MTPHPAPGATAWLRQEEHSLFAFATASAVPDGFGWLDTRGAVVDDRPTETWITARMTHVFSLADLRGEPRAGRLADHGVRALASGLLHDADHGGWHDAVPGDAGSEGRDQRARKGAYPHAFVVLAAASATVAGRPGARELLTRALGVIEEHFWDEDAGALLESWDPAWTTTEDYRGANSNMHAVEAFLAAADATGDHRWTRRALRIAERLVHGVAREHGWRLPEHFTPDWQPLPDYNRDEPDHPFRPYGSTTGHLMEWSRLLVHLAVALEQAGEPVPPWLEIDARALYDHAAERGWGTDGNDGFPYTLDWADTPVVRERMHWVAAEATLAAWALDRRFGEDARAGHYDRWWRYAARHHVDTEHGGWHHELDPEGRPAGGVWSGKPDTYHAYQAVLLPQGTLAPSVAGGLLPTTTPGGNL